MPMMNGALGGMTGGGDESALISNRRIWHNQHRL
jgi:hypothetical protein